MRREYEFSLFRPNLKSELPIGMQREEVEIGVVELALEVTPEDSTALVYRSVTGVHISAGRADVELITHFILRTQ